MIPRAYVTNWRSKAPWPEDSQVEQDLVLSRALVDIFGSDAGKNLALRGGTALNKLILSEPARYSEDIDLVQLEPGPIGGILSSIRKGLDGYLGSPRRTFSAINVTLKYKFDSETMPSVPLKLKIEINAREHTSFCDLVDYHYAVDNPWRSCRSTVRSYCIEELLATKTRALYQRNKGRDLFDIWFTLSNHEVNTVTVMSIFKKYMSSEGSCPSFVDFADNIRNKLQHENFLRDTENLLRKGIAYDPGKACEFVLSSYRKAGYS